MDELIERKEVLKGRILRLEWDKKRRQIHAAKKEKLEQYKKELEEIELKLKGEYKEPEEEEEEKE